MKDITVMLIHYSGYTELYKALDSLKVIRSRIKTMIVIHDQHIKASNITAGDWNLPIEMIEPPHSLNEMIKKLSTAYALFLQKNDCLSSAINNHSLYLEDAKTVLATTHSNRDSVMKHPLLVSVSFLKENGFPSYSELPFKEALFPAWLTKIAAQQIKVINGLLRQTNRNNSRDTIERERFIQKYQCSRIKTDQPTISVMIANYNMGQYLKNALVSCLLQNEAFNQILIIDDGSTDDSYKQILPWQDRKHVQLFRKQNEGKAKALNQLLPHVTSEFILELDADDWLDPNAVSIIKKHLSELPYHAALLYGNLRKWKQLPDDMLFKGIAQGVQIRGTKDLLAYRFPLVNIPNVRLERSRRVSCH